MRPTNEQMEKLVQIRKGSRGRSVQMVRMGVQEQEIGAFVYPEKVQRPKCRDECRDGPRPCPYVGCKYHLYLDVSRKGSIKYNFPDLEPWELPVSCALDAAEVCGMTLDETALLLNVTRERVRQIEEIVVQRLSGTLDALR